MSASDCPGCGLPLEDPQDCDRCEYFNLDSGRYHYCGRPDCYCGNLPGMDSMRPDVLEKFRTRFESWAGTGLSETQGIAWIDASSERGA